MLKVKQLKEFLNDYSDETEVVLPDGSEIKHVGMLLTDNGYKVILANDKDNRIKFQ